MENIWVATPNDELGVYTFPKIFPVLEYGEVAMTFDAGIYINGQTSYRDKYYFYKTYVDTLNLISGNQINLTPKFSYLDATVFSELGSDDFESPIRNYVADNDLTITYEESTENSYERTSAYVFNPNDSDIECCKCRRPD